jgi:hypothetical protein
MSDGRLFLRTGLTGTHTLKERLAHTVLVLATVFVEQVDDLNDNPFPGSNPGTFYSNNSPYLHLYLGIEEIWTSPISCAYLKSPYRNRCHRYPCISAYASLRRA